MHREGGGTLVEIDSIKSQLLTLAEVELALGLKPHDEEEQRHESFVYKPTQVSVESTWSFRLSASSVGQKAS
jgi:hypothetical protein